MVLVGILLLVARQAANGVPSLGLRHKEVTVVLADTGRRLRGGLLVPRFDPFGLRGARQ